jgi:hypothetical protein
MHSAPSEPSPAAVPQPVLDVATICKADHWVDDVLPRFAALVDANCTGRVRRHLLLLIPPPGGGSGPATPEDPRRIEERLRHQWHSVVAMPFEDPSPDRRLLVFDELRSGLTALLGLDELLYIDPDTDVVGDLQGMQAIAPEADLLWAANPLPLQPVVADLVRHQLVDPAAASTTALLEPGFLYLRRDLRAEFAAIRARFPDANDFAPGSTYWHMLMLSLGPRAVRLPDEYNRTFWDIPSAVARAKSVHFTGQWKRLQPFVSYDREMPRIAVHPHPAPLPAAASTPNQVALPAALSVIALYRDNADYLPHAFARFKAWEEAGIPIRYSFLENDSLDATAPLLGDFMRGRRGRLSSRSLAIRYHRARSGQNYDRVMPLARMRNFVMDVAMADAPLAADESTLLLDSEIFFPDDILARVFAARAQDPRPDSIGMLTCYTQQLFLPDQMVVGSPAPDMPGYVLADHYFDTFAFQDADHCHHHPFCCFTRCRRCRLGRPRDYPQRLVGESVPILDVAAAFGGFALLPTRLLQDRRIRWSTYATGFDRARALSEHVVFCDRLRTITGTRVVVLQDVNCIYRK